MSEPLWQPRSDLAARLAGAAFFLGGAGLIAMQVRSILGAIERGETVTYFTSAFALGAMGIVMGAFWLLRGLAGYQATRAAGQDPRGRKVIMIVTVVVIGGTVLALQLWLRSLGYE